MIEIRNLKFQPLTLHLANSKRTVHLAPRGKAEIDDKDVSDEIRNAARRGFIVLRDLKPARQTRTPAPKPVEPPQLAKSKPAAKPACRGAGGAGRDDPKDKASGRDK